MYRLTDRGLECLARECFGLRILRLSGRLNLQVGGLRRDEQRGIGEATVAATGGGSKFIMAVRAMGSDQDGENNREGDGNPSDGGPDYEERSEHKSPPVLGQGT